MLVQKCKKKNPTTEKLYYIHCFIVIDMCLLESKSLYDKLDAQVFLQQQQIFLTCLLTQ